MAVEIKVPSVGESVSEVTISRWAKRDGDFVEKGEPIVELETDKVNQEIAAPAAGILAISQAEGMTVPVGATIGTVAEGARPAGSAAPPANNVAKAAPAPAPAPAAVAPAAAPAPVAVAVAADAPAAKATPLASKMAQDMGVDLRSLPGTGIGGKITRDDILAAATAPKPVAAPAPPSAPSAIAGPTHFVHPSGSRAVSRERMSQLRKRIAQRLVEAQHSAAMLTTFNECDMTAVMALRAKYKEAFQKKHAVGLGFMSFFVKAVVDGLQHFPRLNAAIDGEEILHHHYHDIGVAVGTDRGLVVPVIRNCETLSFQGIEGAIRDYADKAKTGKLSLDDLSGGTFTISNGGVYGSMMSTPILNPPQSGILGMHNIIKRPIAVDDQVVIRPMMYLALSYDHRIVDGKEAVGFLVRVKELIEAPERLLLEV